MRVAGPEHDRDPSAPPGDRALRAVSGWPEWTSLDGRQATGTRFIELSHVLEEGMPVYPGLPEPTFGAILSHAESRSRYEGEAEFYMSKAALPGNLGTYIDAPFHRFAHLEDLSRISLDAVAGLPALVVDAPTSPRAVTLGFDGEMFTSRAVLIRTGWDARWGTKDYWERGPYLADELIDHIVRSGVRLVGVDFWNIDDPADNSRPAHTRLLREGILVVENLCNLGSLPRRGFRFFAVPPMVVRGASFSVRAFAELAGPER